MTIRPTAAEDTNAVVLPLPQRVAFDRSEWAAFDRPEPNLFASERIVLL